MDNHCLGASLVALGTQELRTFSMSSSSTEANRFALGSIMMNLRKLMICLGLYCCCCCCLAFYGFFRVVFFFGFKQGTIQGRFLDRKRTAQLYSTVYNNSFHVGKVWVVFCLRTIVMSYAGNNPVVRGPRHRLLPAYGGVIARVRHMTGYMIMKSCSLILVADWFKP